MYWQRHYEGDGEGDYQIAGLGIPPIALTDGTQPGAEALFKHSLHDVKALYESQAYLKNPSVTDIIAATQQAVLLDSIAHVVNGQPANPSCNPSTSTTTATNSAGSSITNVDENIASRVSSPTNEDTTKGSEKKKKTSPAVAMAEASLLSQQAALKEAKFFEAMIQLQRDELNLRKEDAKQLCKDHMQEKLISFEECKHTSIVLQKIVERLCPEEDPTDRFVARK
jgi:hypothetical protein